MRIKALQAFLIIAAEGSMNAASQVLHISQPALSRMIAQLERELKLTLFHRHHRNLTLTDEGRAFLREARRILANLNEIPRIAAEIRERSGQRLRIVTMPRVALSLVCPAVARFTRDYPDVQISVDLRTRRDLELWIGGKEYDLGIGNVPVAHKAVHGTPLVRTRLEVLLNRDHPLAARPHLTPGEIAGENIIAQFPGLMLREETDALFLSEGIKAHYRLLTSSSQIACQLVAQGAGITIIDPLSAATFDPDRIVLRPLRPARWVTFGVIMANDATPDPLTTGLVESLRQEIIPYLQPDRVEIIDN